MKRVYALAFVALFAASLGAQQPASGVEEPTPLQKVEALRDLAEQGHASAQFLLGLMYANGEGVPQDYAEAVKWYRKAVEQGNASAQSNLGLMYGLGQGMPQDYVQEHKWINLAASHASALDAERYRKARDSVAEKMTSDQIAEAQRLAGEWKAQAADQ